MEFQIPTDLIHPEIAFVPVAAVTVTHTCVFVALLLSLVCKIRSGSAELSKPVHITVEVHEGKVEGRYSIDGKAEMPGFIFVVIFCCLSSTNILSTQHTRWKYFEMRGHPLFCLLFVYQNTSMNCPSRFPTSQKSNPTMGLVLGARSSRWLGRTWMLGRPGKSLSTTCPVL